MNNQRQYPFGSIILMTICILWYIYVSNITSNFSSLSIDVLYHYGAILGETFSKHDYWRLLSATFAHVNKEHIIANMSTLMIFGVIVERHIGTIKYLMLYLLAGIIANYCIVLFDPHVVTAGASGALFGLMGYITVQIFNKKSSLHQIGIGSISMVGFSLISTFITPNVSITAHITGFISGFIFGLIDNIIQIIKS